MNAHQALNAGFSTKNLCTRPNQPIAPSGINEVPRVTRQGPQPMMGANMPTEMDTERAKNIAIAKQIDRLEQQIREALWARTTAHKGEERVLKDAFLFFDKDRSGAVDVKEFAQALEHLGLHTQSTGLPGYGGLQPEVVTGLFSRYDADGSGSLDTSEFFTSLMKETTASYKMT
mmetsp:Transcript_23652/g.47229  ORF Transcript_23652/g.47229 Transcript_23652/m.47229 type:complete len:174 (-) Transcript_23652:282-803(-)